MMLTLMEPAGALFSRHNLYGKRVELFDYFKSIGREMKQPIQVANAVSMYSDHFRSAQSIPAAIYEFNDAATYPRMGHSAADTLDKVSPRSLKVSHFYGEGSSSDGKQNGLAAKGNPSRKNRRSWKGVPEVLEVEKRWPFFEWIHHRPKG